MCKPIITACLSCMIIFNLSSQEICINAIPDTMDFENTPSDFKVIAQNQIQFSSPSRSDLFYSSDEKYITNKSPRLVFKPDSNFVLSAKIQLDFNANWDAGDLIIYNDNRHWAKFCFERDFQEQARVVSVVCNTFADDCNSMAVDVDEIYYKVAGSMKENKYAFYYSEDGASWFPIRSFTLLKTDSLRIGFSVQSPVGEGSECTFSEISYSANKISNWWIGE